MPNDLAESRAGRGRFQPGQSGNPGGRPKGGGKNKLQLYREAIQQKVDDKLCENVLAVLQTVVDAAKGGDMTAAKMVLDRFVPVHKAVDPSTAKVLGGISIVIQGTAAPTTLTNVDYSVAGRDYEVVKSDVR